MQDSFFIIATVRLGHGTTQELYGPFTEDGADHASAILAENTRVIRQIITQPTAMISESESE